MPSSPTGIVDLLDGVLLAVEYGGPPLAGGAGPVESCLIDVVVEVVVVLLPRGVDLKVSLHTNYTQTPALKLRGAQQGKDWVLRRFKGNDR